MDFYNNETDGMNIKSISFNFEVAVLVYAKPHYAQNMNFHSSFHVLVAVDISVETPIGT